MLIVESIITSVASRPEDILLIATSVVILFFSQRQSALVMVIAKLPGTMMHELMHFVAAVVTGSNPSSISILPRRNAGGWILGSVSFSPGFWTGSIVAMAPLALLPVTFFIWRVMPGNALWERFGLSYLIASCLNSAKPSASDAVIAIKHPAGLILLAMVVWVYFKYFSN